MGAGAASVGAAAKTEHPEIEMLARRARLPRRRVVRRMSHTFESFESRLEARLGEIRQARRMQACAKGVSVARAWKW